MALSIIPNSAQAILIGASKFDNDKLLPLPAVENNIKKLSSLLADQKVIGIPNNNITTIVNPATEQDIFLSKLIPAISQASDTLIIYYAGHGLPDNHYNLYLAARKTEPANLAYSGALPFSKIADILTSQDCQAKKIIVILDCCFSGQAITEFTFRGRKQIYLMTSAHSTELAEAPVNATYSTFTHELVLLLEKGINNGNPTLTLDDIHEHIKNQLSNKQFEPKSSSHKDAHKLAIAYNRAFRYQIFVSCAQKDKNWATTLIKDLKNLLGRNLGDKDTCILWMDSEIPDNGSINLEVAKHLEKADFFFFFFSPNYLESAQCQGELSSFLARKSLDSVFLVERRFVEKSDELTDLPSYNIIDMMADQLYFQRLDDFARHLSDRIKSLNPTIFTSEVAPPEVAPIPVTSQVTIFLADVSDDLDERRNELKRFFEQRGQPC